MRRHNSAVSAAANPSNSASLGFTKTGAGTMTGKRSALGEVTNGGKNGDKNKDQEKMKGKAREDRRPLASTVAPPQGAAQRRTRSSLAPTVKEEKPQPKRKATAPTTSKALPPRSRSTTASTSAGDVAPRLKERRQNVLLKEDEAVVVTEPEPARKRRKTSSPAVAAVEGVVEVEDLHDEALYDDDGREIVLSSGGRGMALRSPKRLAKAKDDGWTDLDAEDDGDPTMVSEYVIDAFNYMMSIEKTTMPNPEYMEKQAELQWKMRGILMDWIVEVHQKFRLLPETLFIAVNLIDRFLSARVVSLVKLQLVGLTALFVASKYEEVICPSVTHFLHMTDGGYGVEEILKAERYMLSTLDFDMSYPNPLHFLRRISKADGYDIQTRTVAKFLIEISCVEHKLLKFKPSLLAAAGMWLARLCLERGEWSPNLVHYSTYAEAELLECAQIMLDYVLDPDLNTSSSFFKKYASKKHMKSSTYVRAWGVDRFPISLIGESDCHGMELAWAGYGELPEVEE
ncbi:G2/mitotic-specific cyclin [Saitozyma podzolica]|uniref:G2/mitotic-specific cyclin n=1 Tax=Saitozyma podzolica TaxID=1890683 RepID=A0A427YM73_9TREE|nr:G2/mitotic-specific cyclin [Saitozyma podzolica]